MYVHFKNLGFLGGRRKLLIFFLHTFNFDTSAPNSLYDKTYLRPPGDQLCVGNQMALFPHAAISADQT